MIKRKTYKIRCLSVLIVFFVAVTIFSTTVYAKAPKSPTYDFTKAKVVDRVILSIIEDYYDPDRIDANRMFRSVLDTLQKVIAELTVNYEDNNSVKMEILSESVSFGLSEINSPWSLSSRIRKIFKFLFTSLPKAEYDFMDLEYAAANALLATLDPHSNALAPDIFNDLKMDTAGEFGGLGIKITTDRRPPCSGRLTVVEVFENTPAAAAGLKVGDTIARIDGESTVNITTSEAADRLRGVPGTKVKVQVKRVDGAVIDYTITRKMVPISSVKWEMLKNKIGYIKLNAFQENSVDEMSKALENLHENGMKGLIVDVRGNPGGLLHVAIAIANYFLPAGTIVTTAGRKEDDRTVENASAEGTEPMYPMAVLIDSFSASAAEILAGALRNHNRAILIGDTTFGKGSVQMVDQIPDGGAIKLTSAQYLTPGDISIQAVGVTPDLTFNPIIVDKEKIRTKNSVGRFSEADLDSHLDRPNMRTRTDRSPALTGVLFIPQAEAQIEQNRFKKCFAEKEEDSSYKSQFEKETAVRLLSSAERFGAEDLLIRAQQMIEKENSTQEKAMESAFKKIGVDWSKSLTKLGESEEVLKDTKKEELPVYDPRIRVTAKLQDKLVHGKPFRIRVSVENKTDKPIYRLRAITESDNVIVSNKEFAFGKILPGASQSWTQTIKLPEAMDSRVDDVKIVFDSQSGPIPQPISLEIRIPDRPSPELIFGWQIQDMGNGDGVFEPGEELSMFVTVKNIGEGSASDAEVELSAKPGVDVIHGLMTIGAMAPGQTIEGVMNFKVNENFPLNQAEMTLAVKEWTETGLGIPITGSLREQKISLPVSTVPNSLEPCNLIITVAPTTALLYESPSFESPNVAFASFGASFQADKASNGFYRIALTKTRRAWIAASQVQEGNKPAPNFEPFILIPPQISIEGLSVHRISKKFINVKGIAKHPSSVRDIIVFVGNKKVLYLPSIQNSKSAQLVFNVDVPLEEGANHIMVIARHNDKIMGTRSLFVRRDAEK